MPTIKKENGYDSFSEFFSRFSAKGKISLRRKHFELTMKGSVAMLSKLGDSCLAQCEKQVIINAEFLGLKEGINDVSNI